MFGRRDFTVLFHVLIILSTCTGICIEDIVTAYSAVLGLDTEAFEGRLSTASFPELGGDSMMAINASHRILATIRGKGIDLPDEQIITSLDLLQFPIQVVFDILKCGRDNLPPVSKKARTACKDDEDAFENLPDATIYDDRDIGSALLSKVWKVPLIMCVDSSPVFIEHSTGSIIIASSQGGDLACIEPTTGTALFRTKLPGKIEGDLSFILNAQLEPILFVPTYGASQNQEHRGCIHALKVSKTNTLVPIWQYSTNGEIKNKPTIFTCPKDNSHRVLIASYSGSISYLDAMTGKLLDKQDDLGGAIHATPIIITGDDGLRAIVASSTWMGRVTCLALHADSMEITWVVDLWTPIYATPLHSNDSILICGVDGSVRSLLSNDGNELWKIETENRPIFTKPLHISPSRMVFGSHDGKLRCVNKADGATLWTYDCESPIVSNPIYAKHRVMCATYSGYMFVLNASSGVVMGSIRLPGEIFSNPLLIQEQDIYIGCRDNHLYKLRV